MAGTRARRSLMLAAVICLAAVNGCAAGAGDGSRDASPESIRLRLGESTLVDGGALEIGFEAVTSDSRCAKGDVCVWEGDATVRLSLRHADRAKEERELHTSPRSPDAAAYAGWSIRLATLDPFPVTGHTIPQADYVVTLRVTRGPPAAGDVQ